MTLQLKKFDPSRMADDKVCVFIGKRGTGKSTLVTDILWHKKNIPAGIAMSGTEEGNGYYKQFIPDLFVYGDYNKDALEKIIERQKKLLALGKCNPVFILMDDCMYDRSFMRDVCIRQLFMNGRHWKIFFMMTTQYCMDMTPMIARTWITCSPCATMSDRTARTCTRPSLAFSRHTISFHRSWTPVRRTTSASCSTTHQRVIKSRIACSGTRRLSAGDFTLVHQPFGSTISATITPGRLHSHWPPKLYVGEGLLL